MTRVHRSVRPPRLRPGASRLRRLQAHARLVRRGRLDDDDALPDLSDLILYGQG